MRLQDNEFQHICQSKISQNASQKHSEGGFGADLDRLGPSWGQDAQKRQKLPNFEGPFWSRFWTLFETWSPSRAFWNRKWAASFWDLSLNRFLVPFRRVPKLQSVVNSSKIAWSAISDQRSKMSHFETHFDTQIRHYTQFETLMWAFGCHFWHIEFESPKKSNCWIASWILVKLPRALMGRGGNHARGKPSRIFEVSIFLRPASRPKKMITSNILDGFARAWMA